MRTGHAVPSTASDPAVAFEALRAEVSLLRRALEGLTAAREDVPDYTPTLTGLTRRLLQVEELLGHIADHPAMKLTPASLAEGIARAGQNVRADDRATIQRSIDSLQVAVRNIDSVVEQARTAERQLYWLCGSGVVGLCLGVMASLAVAQL